MDWICGIQQGIDYIEAHLTETLDYQDIARQAYSSVFQFQRVFHILCGYTLGEYIRARRLTLATYDAEETHSEVAAMFSMELDNRLNHNEREKALNDTVLKVKNNSIQYQIDQAADPAQIQQLYTMKNKLSAIHITL